MITRFRFEAEGDNKEEVVSELDEVWRTMKHYLQVSQPRDGWEITDEYISAEVDDDGDAFIAGRRVYRRTWHNV